MHPWRRHRPMQAVNAAAAKAQAPAEPSNAAALAAAKAKAEPVVQARPKPEATRTKASPAGVSAAARGAANASANSNSSNSSSSNAAREWPQLPAAGSPPRPLSAPAQDMMEWARSSTVLVGAVGRATPASERRNGRWEERLPLLTDRALLNYAVEIHPEFQDHIDNSICFIVDATKLQVVPPTADFEDQDVDRGKWKHIGSHASSMEMVAENLENRRLIEGIILPMLSKELANAWRSKEKRVSVFCWCKHGKHRSVALAFLLAWLLRMLGFNNVKPGPSSVVLFNQRCFKRNSCGRVAWIAYLKTIDSRESACVYIYIYVLYLCVYTRYTIFPKAISIHSYVCARTHVYSGAQTATCPPASSRRGRTWTRTRGANEVYVDKICVNN